MSPSADTMVSIIVFAMELLRVVEGLFFVQSQEFVCFYCLKGFSIDLTPVFVGFIRSYGSCTSQIGAYLLCAESVCMVL